MKMILKSEELAQLVVAVIVIIYVPVNLDWWVWPVLFFAPDISMLAYLAGNKIGGFTYNLFHYKGTAALVLICGFAFSLNILMIAGLILWAHSSFDRVLGYGLKYADSFQHTHLGKIGR